MKPNQERTTQLQREAFTLVEMLVVIAIISILAGILVPVVGRAKTKSRVAAARVEMAGLELAIKTYHNDYSRWPLPKGAASWTNDGGDFTYGSKGAPRNEALMQILMAEAGNYNTGHERNPKKNKYIDPKDSGETNDLPGFSTTGRYHDPFGNEYIISLDLDSDGGCADQDYYNLDPDKGGLFGLVKHNEINDDKPDNKYVYKGEVMIWSFGPDKTKRKKPGESGSKTDNILSWR